MSRSEEQGPTVREGEAEGAAIHPFPHRGGAQPAVSEPPAASAPVVSFDRRELREILNLYGRGVASGDWRDYAIGFTSAKAIFNIYRRASEVPMYRIEKDPSLARRQGAYSVVAATGLILKRGHDLALVLRVLEKKPKLVVV